MFQDNISLTQQDILEKEFKIDARGYRMPEVDKFLDQVIGDYGSFYKEIENKNKEISRLNDELLLLKQELRNAKSNIELASDNMNVSGRQITNVDLLQRVSRLEETLYGDSSK